MGINRTNRDQGMPRHKLLKHSAGRTKWSKDRSEATAKRKAAERAPKVEKGLLYAVRHLREGVPSPEQPTRVRGKGRLLIMEAEGWIVWGVGTVTAGWLLTEEGKRIQEEGVEAS